MASNAKNFAARWSNASVPPWVAERERRKKDVARLCRLLHTTKAMVCDAFLSLVPNVHSVDPNLVEKLLVKRGLYRGEEGVSIRDVIVRHYGEEAAELCERLF